MCRARKRASAPPSKRLYIHMVMREERDISRDEGEVLLTIWEGEGVLSGIGPLSGCLFLSLSLSCVPAPDAPSFDLPRLGKRLSRSCRRDTTTRRFFDRAYSSEMDFLALAQGRERDGYLLRGRGKGNFSTILFLISCDFFFL